MSSTKISYAAYPKLLLEAVIFVFYCLLGKRRDYYKANMLPNPERPSQIWDLRYSEFQTRYVGMKELKESYEKKVQTTSAFQSVIDFTREFKKPKILEVGFGRAGDLVAIKKELKDVELYGVESSTTSLEIGEKISNSLDCDLNLLKGDAYHLPFHDNVFDMVFLSQVFEHLLDPVGALKEQIRVIKNEGYLVIGVPQLYHIHTIIKHAVVRARVVQGELGELDETEYSAKELRNMLTLHGLEIKEIVGRGSLFDEWIWKQMLRFLPRTSRFLKSHLHKYFSGSLIITAKKVKG